MEDKKMIFPPDLLLILYFYIDKANQRIIVLDL